MLKKRGVDSSTFFGNQGIATQNLIGNLVTNPAEPDFLYANDISHHKPTNMFAYEDVGVQ